MNTRQYLYFSPEGGAGSGGDGGAGDGGDGTGDDAKDTVAKEDFDALKSQNDALTERLTKLERESKAASRSRTKADPPKKDTPDPKDEEISSLRADIERTKQEARIERALNVASGLKAIDSEAVVALVDWSDLSDPDDKAEVKDAIAAVLKARPHLVKTESKDDKGRRMDGGKGGGQQVGEVTMNDRIRAAAGRRTIQQD